MSDSKRRTHQNKVSVAETHPELVDRFVNPDDAWAVTAGSSKMVAFRCECGNAFEKITANFVRSEGQRNCGNRSKGIVCPRRCVAVTHPAVAVEMVDYWLARELTYGSHKKVWWRCLKCQHRYKRTVQWRTSGMICPKCYQRSMDL